MSDAAPLGGDARLGAELDLAAARAWPAREVEIRDGWWFRANDGLHRRVNSVFPDAAVRTPLADHIAEAEAFYRAHGLPPRFQISPATLPADLDRVLADRGYVVESGVDIMIADTAALAAGHDPTLDICLDAAMSVAWLDVHMADAPDDATKRRKGEMLTRIKPGHVFASLRAGGETVAAGLAIADENWFGVFGMFTLERARRRSHARALLAAMAGWALARGCGRAYLQVERDNPAAIAVYGRAGFRTVHGYHYRTLWNILMPDADITVTCDTALPFQVDRLGVRGRLVRLCEAAAPVMREGRYPPVVRALALDTLALTALLASTLKYEGVFSLQIQGDGPISLLVADATSEGELRVYAKYDADALAAMDAAAGAPPVNLFGAGHMAFTVDQGPDTERYQGITEIAGNTLAECAAAYFHQSEQLDTTIVGAHADAPAPNRAAAAALLVQRLPAQGGDADEADEAWREAAVLASTAAEAELLDTTLAPEHLLYRLYHESGVRTFEPQALRFACRCSRERVARTLASFPRGEIDTLRVDGHVVVTCEFCGTDYAFDDQALDAVFSTVANA